MTKQFQTSLFGYSKQSVHLYISRMNEDFTNKMLEKEKEERDTIQSLNEELKRLQEENKQLRSERDEVASALIEAKTCAAGLMEQAEKTYRVQHAKNEDALCAEQQRLLSLAKHIDTLRGDFQAILNNMAAELEQYNLICSNIQAECAEMSEKQQETAENKSVAE